MLRRCPSLLKSFDRVLVRSAPHHFVQMIPVPPEAAS